jgi:hypothetical protein
MCYHATLLTSPYPILHLGMAENHITDLFRRYLRARSYDPQAAFRQYSTTAEWRASKGVDNVFDNASLKLFDHTRRLFPHWSGRRDKQGLPLFIYVVGDVQTSDLVEMAKLDPELTSIVLPAETATAFDLPLCAMLHQDGVVDRGVNIIDLTGVGLRQFWTLRNHLQSASHMATAHYPETVDQMFIIGAPSYFPTVWNFITKWFDPTTTSKIHVLPTADVLSTLEKYIDKENIPVRFGGDHQWSFGQTPSLDEEFRPFVGDLMDKWTPGPLRFLPSEAGFEVLAVGTADNGQKRRDVIGIKSSRDVRL